MNNSSKKTCDDYEPNGTNCATCGHSEQDHFPHIQPRNCDKCGESIPLQRLDLLPNTPYCTPCSKTHSPKIIHDPEILCSKSSPAGGNGFSPKS